MSNTNGWTDDELRQAIHEAAELADQKIVSVWHDVRHGPGADVSTSIADLRHLLTALGIDHQPKPKLPTEPGSMIYDVETVSSWRFRVMELDDEGYWCGHTHSEGENAYIKPHLIASFGGVLDLDKVRGEQS